MDQRDVDFLFNVTIIIHEDEWFGKRKNKRDRNEVQNWVAEKLKEHGVDTEPIGMSWGVIVSPEGRKELDALKGC